MDCVLYLPRDLTKLIFEWYEFINDNFYPQIIYRATNYTLKHIAYRLIPYNKIVLIKLKDEPNQHYLRKGADILVKLKHQKKDGYIFLNINEVENGVYRGMGGLDFLLSGQGRCCFKY